MKGRKLVVLSGYTGKWKVLGAEKGKLLIMSTIDVGTLTLSGKEGYNTGISKLNAMCATYGKNSRSITVEDINRVTGYDPTNTGTGTKYEVGNVQAVMDGDLNGFIDSYLKFNLEK